MAVNMEMDKDVISNKPSVDPILDNHGKPISMVNGIMDLRDHYLDDVVEIIKMGIRNESHRGKNKVRLPVSCVLLTQEEYEERMKPSWFVGTKYEYPMLFIIGLAVIVIMASVPFIALEVMELRPEEYRIHAKDKQSKTGSG